MREKAECILCTSALLYALLNGVELRPRDRSIIFILGDDPIYKGPKYYQPSLATNVALNLVISTPCKDHEMSIRKVKESSLQAYKYILICS